MEDSAARGGRDAQWPRVGSFSLNTSAQVGTTGPSGRSAPCCLLASQSCRSHAGSVGRGSIGISATNSSGSLPPIAMCRTQRGPYCIGTGPCCRDTISLPPFPYPQSAPSMTQHCRLPARSSHVRRCYLLTYPHSPQSLLHWQRHRPAESVPAALGYANDPVLPPPVST